MHKSINGISIGAFSKKYRNDNKIRNWIIHKLLQLEHTLLLLLSATLHVCICKDVCTSILTSCTSRDCQRERVIVKVHFTSKWVKGLWWRHHWSNRKPFLVGTLDSDWPRNQPYCWRVQRWSRRWRWTSSSWGGYESQHWFQRNVSNLLINTPPSITMTSRTSGAASSSSTEMPLLVHDPKKYTRKSDFVLELSDSPDDIAGGYERRKLLQNSPRLSNATNLGWIDLSNLCSAAFSL